MVFGAFQKIYPSVAEAMVNADRAAALFFASLWPFTWIAFILEPAPKGTVWINPFSNPHKDGNTVNRKTKKAIVCAVISTFLMKSSEKNTVYNDGYFLLSGDLGSQEHKVILSIRGGIRGALFGTVKLEKFSRINGKYELYPIKEFTIELPFAWGQRKIIKKKINELERELYLAEEQKKNKKIYDALNKAGINVKEL